MRETRKSGSEGGGAGKTGAPYPYHPPAVVRGWPGQEPSHDGRQRHCAKMRTAAYRTRNVLDVVQGAHDEVTAPVVGRVVVRTLVAR